MIWVHGKGVVFDSASASTSTSAHEPANEPVVLRRGANDRAVASLGGYASLGKARWRGKGELDI